MGFLAAIASAALFVLAFPTTELAPLAFVALVPLLVAQRGRRRWQRFRMGWLVGFLVELVLFRWIPFTMDQMTSLPDAVTYLMWVVYAAWHGLQIGVFAMLCEPLRLAAAARAQALGPIAVALWYAVLEWLWPVIFPWGIGHAVWQLPWAGAVLALQGVPLLTFMVVLVNALLAELVATIRAPVRHRPIAELIILASVLLVAFLARPGTDGRTLRVAVIQPNYTLAEKKRPDLAQRHELLERFEGLIRGLPPDTFDLVIAPEGSFPLWWRVERTTAPLSDATRRIQRAIAEGPATDAIFGGLRKDDQGHSRNSALHFAGDGRIRDVYDKQTLVPFSEYVPLADLFPGLTKVRGISSLVPGERPCAFRVPLAAGADGASAAIGVSCGICYETMFAADTRRDAADAALLVNLTIDTWFGDSTAPPMHLMSHAARAAELGVPLVRAALTGITAVIDHRGVVVGDLPRNAPGVLTHTVELADGATLYRAVGQWFAPLALVACLLGLGYAFVRRRAASPAPPPPPPREEAAT